MTEFDLLDTVLPAVGRYAVVGITETSVWQEFVDTREDVTEVAEFYLKNKRNVFFGVAKYGEEDSRKKSNVVALRAFWLDIDCGPSKADINEKTGKPKGYVDQRAGLLALRAFTQTTGLPKPIVVNSGRGLHVYWPLTEDITREQWEPAASRLRALCNEYELHIDPAVFEVARILRLPGTYNFKGDTPLDVTVLMQGDAVSFEDFCSRLGMDGTPRPSPIAPASHTRRPSALAQAMRENIQSRFQRIMLKGMDGCRQLIDCYTQQETLEEPRWFDALSIAKFCVDRDTAIHRMSHKHPDYAPDRTEQKLRHIVGPHTCNVFAQNNPSGCDGCPHLGKIKSPIVLGRELAEAADDEDEEAYDEEGDGELDPDDTFFDEHEIPSYPVPYARGKNGGIYRLPPPDEPEAVPVLVYEHDFYVVKRMRDPLAGDVAVMRLHLPKDGMREFSVPMFKVMDTGELRKSLATEGVACSRKKFDLLTDYIITAVRELQFNKKAETMRLQFGWADNDSKFIVGDREITASGVFHSPPSQATAQIAQHITPAGTMDKWKEVFALYGRKGLEGHAFGALTGFGAPLLKFLGQRGAVINLIHPSSGTGKTTVLHMCQSIWGNPDALCAQKDDTLNAKIMRMGIHNNLPVCFDEMTNTLPQDLSTLAYCITQGKGKDRMKSSGNELRTNLTSWQTMALCSSNASFNEKLGLLKNAPEGELMRIIEYKIEQSSAIDTALAKHMFDHQLLHNYGHAGMVYASWLVANYEEVRDGCLSVQSKIDKELKLTQRERFWSAVVAANLTGGLIAKRLGLIDWDMQAIYQWCTRMILDLREEVAPPAASMSAVVGEYINQNISNVLVVNDGVDRRSNLPAAPQMEPRGELTIRYEPDTKRLYMLAKPFKEYCVTYQLNYKGVLKELKDSGIYIGTQIKRLSKGMKVAAPGVHCLVFDGGNSEFIKVDALVGLDTDEQAAPAGEAVTEDAD